MMIVLIRKTVGAVVCYSLLFLSIDLLFAEAVSADSNREDYLFIIEAHTAESSAMNWRRESDHEISPLGFVGNSLLTIYQTLVSSQDSKVCNFTPSCSHFAREAVNRVGFIRGTLMASDRLLRCHPYAFGQYRFDPRLEKSIDPVDDYIGGKE
jgi:putative membrane protein insertion efficiency factor